MPDQYAMLNAYINFIIGLFASFLPWWRMRPEQIRWTICTEDVFFANKYISKMLGAGNSLPLDRSGSLDQPNFQIFQQKLNKGAWCHIFPEVPFQSQLFDIHNLNLLTCRGKYFKDGGLVGTKQDWASSNLVWES